MLHNYTPSRWFECDAFEVTKAGYFREYEVKLTVQDFRADTRKEQTRVEYEPQPVENGRTKWNRKEVSLGTKHELLADPRRALTSKFTLPVQFWFVIPESLHEAVKPVLPEFAGLIIAVPFETRQDPHGVRLSEMKAAPRLHNELLADEILNNARSVCYYRMHSLFCRGRMLHEKDKV